MNTIKFSLFIRSQFKRNFTQVAKDNVRCLSSGGKLVDLQVNSQTGIYTVKMQRRPVNSLSLELVTEFISAMTKIETEKGRGMIITSSFPGIFTAGLDLMELYKPQQDRLRAYWTSIQDMWLKLYGSTYSTVAAISGHAPGAGCLISISCDYRVMVKGAFGIGLNETHLGLAAPSWFIDTYRNVLPFRVSENALITGKMFPVEEALNVGLIDEIAVDDAEALSKAEAYISRLSKLPQCGVQQTKLSIRHQHLARLQENRKQDLKIFESFITSQGIQKALEQYMKSLKK